MFFINFYRILKLKKKNNKKKWLCVSRYAYDKKIKNRITNL